MLENCFVNKVSCSIRLLSMSDYRSTLRLYNLCIIHILKLVGFKKRELFWSLCNISKCNQSFTIIIGCYLQLSIPILLAVQTFISSPFLHLIIRVN